ncbi:MAG: SDR family oxidoreductase [Brachymonas sp.]|nr:SDR family oxidoreductase [Brachymonas sp.]
MTKTADHAPAPSDPLVFITGASSGIGQALALRFYRTGYRLALVARRTQAVHDWAIQNQIAAGRYAVYSADVSVIDQIVAAGQSCIATQGVPDVVIASAGISHGIDTAEREDLDVMADIYATNCVGLAATFHPFIKAMRARRSGKLVGIASVTGIRGLPGHGAYCSSKAAVISYCESLRGEMRDANVQVITLLPGYIDTPMTAHDTYKRHFLLSPEQFAERACKAITAGVSYRVIPWQMGVTAKILRLLPNWLFDRILSGRARKPRKQH